jgi:hypothetical protein
MKTRVVLFFLVLTSGLALHAANPTSGVTIITHGYQSELETDGSLPQWVREMADAINDQVGISMPIYRVRYDKRGTVTPADDEILLEDGATSIDISGGAIILLDWVGISNEPLIYSTEGIASRFFDYLFSTTDHTGGHFLFEVPLHFIGHSRGASLNSAMIYALAYNGVLVDHVTTLDPHPSTAGSADDWEVASYINILFAENYWRHGLAPQGDSVAGAFDVNLDDEFDGAGDPDCSEHSAVHTYYYGTMNTTADDDGAGCSVLTYPWFTLEGISRDITGFAFSRYARRVNRDSAGVNQFISGAGGTGSRVSVDSPQQLWSNAGFDQRTAVSSVVTVGQPIDFPYYFADRNSQQTITFHTDADTNPFNGERTQIGSVNQNSRPAGSIGTATFQWIPTAADVGTHFIRVRASNASGKARYDYFFKSITVQAAPTPTPTISSVTPRTFTGPTRLITIVGTGFTSSSRLTFNDGVNLPYTDRVPANWTPTQLTYDITVSSNPATWTVKVVNGAVESLPYSFYIVSGTAQLTSLGVSGPFAIAENGSGQFTATAYFSDGSQQNVTSSASWSENSSATTISSSGLLSAGSVGSDTAVTASASYTTGGITKSANANVTIANSASCGSTTSEKILNGNFANNGNNWSLAGNFFANANFSVCNSCPGYAWFANADGTGGNNLSGTLSQSITIPANATSVTLGYYYRITTTDSLSVAKDFLYLNLVLPGGTLVGIDQKSNTDANSSYTFRSFDITAYRGQTLTVRFTATTDGSGPTTFRVDDVSVIQSVPNPVTPVLFGVGGPTNVAEGGTAQYNAIVVNCDGSIQSVTPTWSENSSAASISSSGLLTVGSVSSDTSVTIMANYNGTILNFPITVVNSAASFSYLAISGPSSINENSSGQFTASAIFSDGSSQSVSPSWSENSSATTISGGGLLNAGEIGSDTTVSVSASHTIGGTTRNANQDVLIVNIPPPVTLSSLSISGPNSVNENSAAQYSVTAFFSNGSSQSVNPTWSEDSAATSVSIFGLLSAGEVASDTAMTVSASYTFNAVTRNASTNVMVRDVVQPTALRIGIGGSQIALSWPTNSAGFVLEYATNMPPTGWHTNATTPIIANGRYTVTNAMSSEKMFYRLKK